LFGESGELIAAEIGDGGFGGSYPEVEARFLGKPVDDSLDLVPGKLELMLHLGTEKASKDSPDEFVEWTVETSIDVDSVVISASE